MFEWIIGLVSSWGYAGVATLTLLENAFPPIPSELIMPLAGFVASRGELNLALTIAAGTTGSLAGAIGWYLLGRRLGERELREWFDRHGRWLGMAGDDIDRSKDWFKRHGALAVLIGRLVPGVRTFISIPAGIAGMRPVPFVAYSLIGTALWTAALTYAGYLLQAQYQRVSGVLDVATWAVLGAFVAAYVVRVLKLRRSDARATRGRVGGRTQ